MKRQKNLTGYLLILAAITFWISWFLMPDPGTTDTNHILAIVKQARISVLCSVIIQIVSSVLYILALFSLTRFSVPQKKITLIGISLFGIGAMGLCADAFFHLLAFFMTDDSVNIQQDVVRVMNFMQTTGVVFLIPLLLPLFIGSIVLAVGLKTQGVISKIPAITFTTAFSIGIVGAIIAKKVFEYNGPILSLITLGLFAAGQALIGLEILASRKRIAHNTHNKIKTDYLRITAW
jgi:hypothetical protein